MILYGTSGTRWELEDICFAKGGEGELYSVKGTKGHVVKLYKDGVLTPTKTEKLTYMTTLYSKDRLNQLAWPIDMVKDQSGQIKGFVMKKFNATEDMADLLDESSNQSMNLDWKKRIIIALNLSLLVEEIHSMGQIIGDMNPKNFGVDMNNGFVCAFDTDSFHLYNATAHKWYPCTVLDPHYIAPELQEKFQKGQRVDSFRPEETFTAETDRFALAILIFQLLFNGTHPFTAARVPNRGSSVVVHSRVTNIYQRMCPYFNPSPNVTLPRYAPPLSIVPANIQNAFRKAFLTGNRPQASEWVKMLNMLRRQLITCPQGHYYGKYNTACPWCKPNNKLTPPEPDRPNPEPNPGPNPDPHSNSNYNIRKTRSWYAHEFINFIAWIITIAIPSEEKNKILICSVAFLCSLISRCMKRKNETLPTGAGAKFMAWWNIIIGLMLFIASILMMAKVINTSDPDDAIAGMLSIGLLLTIYGGCSIRDYKKV